MVTGKTDNYSRKEGLSEEKEIEFSIKKRTTIVEKRGVFRLPDQ